MDVCWFCVVIRGTALFFMASQPLYAQEHLDNDIVVTGQGLEATPANAAYSNVELDADDLRRAASGRIEGVLQSIAGIQQFRRSDSRAANPTAQGVTLRALGGNATSRALILLDGVPMVDPFFGHVPLSALAPERLSSIRVTRGGGAGAFGAGGLAGTIELVSADAADLGLAKASAFANQRGESELSAAIAPKLGSGFAVLSVRRDNGKGFWTTPASQRAPQNERARYASWSTSLRFVAPVSDTVTLQVQGLVFDDARTLRFVGARTTATGQDASLRLVGRGAWQFEGLAYVQARNFSNVVISSTTFRKTLDQRRTPSTGLGGKLELRPPVGRRHVLRLGGEWRRSSGVLQEEPYGTVAGVFGVTARRRAGGQNADLGVYIEDDWTLDRLTVTGGARADRWTVRSGHFRETDPTGHVTIDNRFANRSGWATSFRGGALWRASDALSLRAAAYTSLRLPTLNELYRPFVVFPVTTRSNAALRNERLRGYEAGIDVHPLPGFDLSVTAFNSRVRHAVANVTIGPNLRERRNLRAITARGVEVDSNVTLGDFSLESSLAWTDARMRAGIAASPLEGLRPAQTPKFSASVRGSWKPAPGWLLSAAVRQTGEQFEDDLGADVLPAATTFDAFAEVPLHRAVSLVLRGENLTDERVLTRNQGGSIDLGAPRTIWVGMHLTMR